MGELTYVVKTPQLLKRLKLKPMDLVRKCGLAVNTAYDAADKEKANKITMDTALKIFNGLRENGFQIELEDVVEFQSNGR